MNIHKFLFLALFGLKGVIGVLFGILIIITGLIMKTGERVITS